ncbi:DUF4360 domain-containing protein [Streptomyces sp. 6N223]|uniref:DUF4360 domain-containing protein n=1 Tax=Streptomyces sp. 6N223 TaxID=3457412 RepID=UPI003FD49232
MSRVLAAGGAAVALLAATFASPTASAESPSFDIAEPPYFTDVPPDQMAIDLLTVNGSGCEPGTAAVAVNEDNTAFTVTYSDYLAMVGVGAGATDFRKNCQLNLAVKVPSGFTYAIASVDYRGYASLAEGATGIEKASYYFQGSEETDEWTHSFPGPMEDNWSVTDITDLESLVWAPCGEIRNFNINTELRVNAGTSDTSSTTSFMTMDSTDGEIETTYHVAWKECPPEGGS